MNDPQNADIESPAEFLDRMSLVMDDHECERMVAERDARVRADALREAARDFPTRSHAHHACFREDAHLVPRGCFYGPDWLRERADREQRIPPVSTEEADRA